MRLHRSAPGVQSMPRCPRGEATVPMTPMNPAAKTDEGHAPGVLYPAEGDRDRLVADLPTDCVQNHAANLMPLPDGDLGCVWFGGTQEGIADISIYFSRLAMGGNRWSHPVKLSDDPTRSEQNPILFVAPDGKLWLLHTSQKSGNQDTAVVKCRVSADSGRTWGPGTVLFDTPGTFVRQPLVVLDNGDWLAPVFRCLAAPGEKWVGNHDVSAVRISGDRGATWSEHPVPGSTGCVHMNVVRAADGGLLAFFRSRWADSVYSSQSTDSGRHWTEPQPTELPNNNSSIQVDAPCERASRHRLQRHERGAGERAPGLALRRDRGRRASPRRAPPRWPRLHLEGEPPSGVRRGRR